MVDRILAAPFWVLNPAVATTVALSISVRGREPLRAFGRQIPRPIGAWLFAAVVCGLMTTFADLHFLFFAMAFLNNK